MQPDRYLIGTGRVSSVFSDGIYAYKTFTQTYPIEWINNEVLIQNEIKKKTSLPVLNYTFLKNTREIRMDLIKGISLADRLRHEKYKDAFHDMQQLQTQIYQYSKLDLPDAHEVFEKQIKQSNLSEKHKSCALSSLNSCLKMDILCHFDFHPENIMFDGTQYYIIDWVNARLGNPVLDLARTFIILKQYISRQANKYLREITNTLGIDIAEVMKVVPAMAAIRLLEMDKGEFKESLVEMIESHEHELLYQ